MKRLLLALALVLAGWTADVAPSYSQAIQPGQVTAHPAARAAVRPSTFDGTNDYLSRSSALSGIADGKTGTISAWFYVSGGAASTRVITGGLGNDCALFLNGSNQLSVLLRAVDNSSQDILVSNSTFTAVGWHHVVTSWDRANDLKHMYIDDASDLQAVTLTDANIGYNQAGWFVGAGGDPAGSAKLTGNLAEVYFSTSYIDLSVEANRRKFISPDGRPVPMGAKCERPTGSQPILCLTNPPSSFQINKGSGGDFTVNGELTAASSSP